MQLPVRYAPVLFGARLSAIRTGIVSAFVLVISRGLYAGLPEQWLKSCALTWPVAFPTVTLIAPWVRRVVAQLTD